MSFSYFFLVEPAPNRKKAGLGPTPLSSVHAQGMEEAEYCTVPVPMYQMSAECTVQYLPDLRWIRMIFWRVRGDVLCSLFSVLCSLFSVLCSTFYVLYSLSSVYCTVFCTVPVPAAMITSLTIYSISCQLLSLIYSLIPSLILLHPLLYPLFPLQ
jgi:hypothetical protein